MGIFSLGEIFTPQKSHLNLTLTTITFSIPSSPVFDLIVPSDRTHDFDATNDIRQAYSSNIY